MVDSAATGPGGGIVNPGGPRRPGPKGKGKRGKPPPRRAQNPPQIDIVNAASPVEEMPQDYPNVNTVFSTGTGGAEMYHYHREAMHTQEQLARPESAPVEGPGQP